MTVPDYADPRPPNEQIADDLRGQIKSGRLKPGDRLPSNDKLSDRYEVARGTVRSALNKLSSEGLIQAKGTRGTFVLRPPAESEIDPAEQLRQLMSRLEEVVQRVEKLEERDRMPLPHGAP